MILQYNDYTADITRDCDVCVIGSGAGGAVAAKELAESGLTVALLEEGGHHTARTWDGKPARGVIDMYRHGGSTGAMGNPFISLTLGKCVGGTTTINSGTCFRTPDRILEQWRSDLGLAHLTPESMTPYFECVEKAINVTELPWDILGNSAKIIRRGADALGLNCRPLKHNMRDCRGCGTCQFGCLDNAKQSMGVTYIPEAMRHGAAVYADCRAEKLLIRDGAVRGVTARAVPPGGKGARYRITVNARAVVVACGSMITPAFLRGNGLRNRHIGRHLQIHPAGRALALMDEKVEGWKGVSQGAYIDDFENEGIMLEGIFVHPSLLLAGLPGVGMGHKELAAQYPYLAALGVMIHDSTEGRVRRGPRKGSSWAHYFITRPDVEKLKRGIAYTARIFFAAGARKVYTSISSMPVLEGPDDVEKLLAARVRANHIEMMAFHPLGTCRMAADRKRGVVDGRGESFEVRGLYVCDGSIVPTSLGVNPQVTIMALATRVARGIAARLA